MLAPRVAEVLQQPVKEAALLARELGRPTLVFRTNMPSFSVYRQAITPNREAVAGDLVFLRRDKLERFATARPDLATEILYQRGQIALILVSDAVPISAPIPSGPASGD